ncbi:hypothetical protein U9Y70_20545, partial [Escherichia coli]
MECQNRSDKYIWSPHDAYFYKGLSELIVDIDRLIYLSLEKIRKDFVFINLSTDSLSEFINRDNEWLSAVKGKQVVLIAARKSEALANYWYYNSNIRGVVYAGLSRDIRKELVYVINGRFLRKDIKKLNLQSKCNKKRSTHQLEYNFVSTQKPFPNDEYFLPTSYNKRA